jgi:hypothetical protein
LCLRAESIQRRCGAAYADISSVGYYVLESGEVWELRESPNEHFLHVVPLLNIFLAKQVLKVVDIASLKLLAVDPGEEFALSLVDQAEFGPSATSKPILKTLSSCTTINRPSIVADLCDIFSKCTMLRNFIKPLKALKVNS